jgi:hypothetical protein
MVSRLLVTALSFVDHVSNNSATSPAESALSSWSAGTPSGTASVAPPPPPAFCRAILLSTSASEVTSIGSAEDVDAAAEEHNGGELIATPIDVVDMCGVCWLEKGGRDVLCAALCGSTIADEKCQTKNTIRVAPPCFAMVLLFARQPLQEVTGGTRSLPAEARERERRDEQRERARWRERAKRNRAKAMRKRALNEVANSVHSGCRILSCYLHPPPLSVAGLAQKEKKTWAGRMRRPSVCGERRTSSSKAWPVSLCTPTHQNSG